jgi:hypothetical protein
METSPYQAPESNVEIGGVFKRSIWWKIYFFLITIMSAFGLISYLADPNAGLAEYISLFLWLVATTGLFGFVFLKAIYKPDFWLYMLVTYLIFTVAYYFITSVDLRMGMSDSEFYISTAIGVLLSLPGYYALYSDSKSDNPAWKNT